ncbi:MAG: ComEC/Rec2 family competence protein [Thermoanaerobaculia bacterium]
MRSKDRIPERLFGLAFLIAALCGCGSAKPEVDYPWTEQEQRAAAEVAADLERQAAAAPSMAPMAAPAPPAAAAAAAAPASLLEIYVFDIGQADSMLVIGPAPDRKTLLVDLGKPSAHSKLPAGFTTSQALVSRRIRELTGRSDVDYFVLSHYHSDHAGGFGNGMIGLLSGGSFKVGEFIHVVDDGERFMAAEDERGVYRTIRELMPVWEQHHKVGSSSPPSFGTGQIDLGPGVTVDILAFAGKVPSGASALENVESRGVDYSEAPANENDLSIALQISAGEFELFTGGDLTGTDDPARRPLYVPRSFSGGKKETYTNVEHPLVAHWKRVGRESDVEVYRANHHGSQYSTTPNLLKALDPEFILYSTGADYGHPSGPVIARGGATARQLATTSVSNSSAFTSARGKRVGEIRILVAPDGESYTINGERHRAFSASEEAAGRDDGEEDRH